MCAMHSDLPWMFTARARYADRSTSTGFIIVKIASPVVESNVAVYSSSSVTTSSFSRHQITSGTGIPFTTHLNSIDLLALTFLGFTGSRNVGASPVSSESKSILPYRIRQTKRIGRRKTINQF